MKITIELKAGPHLYLQRSTKRIITKNIEAVERAIDGKPLVCDTNYLIDTKSILEAIKEQLPDV